MQSRPKVWITSIILLFIAAFLVGFAPIRLERKRGFTVQSQFAFETAEPIYDSREDIDDRQEEIAESLTEAGLDEAEVTILEDNLLTVETFAVKQEQAERNRKLVLETLRNEFEQVELSRAPGEEEKEEPIATFWHFGIYTPIPQLRLGLDLQGGAHVVLRCLSDAELSFVLPEDTPLVAEEDQEFEEGQFRPPFTEEQLVLRVTSLLQQTGADPTEADVQVIGGNRLEIHTRPDNKRQVERQQEAVYEFLMENYPGLDIERVEPSAVFVDDNTAEQVKYIIEQRLYRFGEIREPVIQKQGYDRIIVEMPGVKDPQRVMDILKDTAMLEFRLVPDRYKPIGTLNYEEWEDTQSGQTVTWEQVRAESPAEFSGRDLQANATVQSGQAGDWVVAFELKPNKKDDFHQFTRRHIGQIMAITLDRECQMAPVIRSAIPGNGIIEGNMDAEEASDLRLLLNAGALPVPLEIVENRTVSATLGEDSIVRSLKAASYGVIAVMIFMIAYYRLPGLLADAALTLYIALVIAVTAYSEVTLTLPGIAGIILSLGTAVDANVIIFERLKEELWSRKSLRSAVAAGFDRAWTAILDANVTTLIAAAVLYWLGTSLIKGFAIMLFIGVVCHLFTAVTVTRWLLTMVADARWAQRRGLYGVGERSEEADQVQPA
ncbi:MAG: protein translocase subunit SecD [Armatimonadota bacterium]|nr:protein translocase subunit SecD [Armatimonadota bacterium]